MKINTNARPQDTKQSIARSLQKTCSSPKLIQAKLTIGQPNDKYEREADKVADQVVNSKPAAAGSAGRMPVPAIQSKPRLQKMDEEEVQAKPFPSIMRMGEEELQARIQKTEEEEVQAKPADGTPQVASDSIQTQIEQSKGGGSPLSSSTRSFMESSMGADFSNVRIHNNSNAHRLSAKLNAQAFAVGNNVFFNQGKYNPESQSGKHLLAHELTHTMQQGSAIQTRIQKQDEPTKVSKAERKASYKTPLKLWKLTSNFKQVNTLGVEQNAWVLQDFPINAYEFPSTKGDLPSVLKPVTDKISKLKNSGIGIAYTLAGLASSSGNETINEELRALRTYYMRDHAPESLKRKVKKAEPSANDFYIASNASPNGRAKNRSVILVEEVFKEKLPPVKKVDKTQERIIVSNYPGWTAVDGEDWISKVRELPHFIRVKSNTALTKLKVAEGKYRGQIAAYKNPTPDKRSSGAGDRKTNTDWSFGYQTPKSAVNLLVEYRDNLSPYANDMVIKGVIKGIGADVPFLTEKSNYVPLGAHDIEIPDYQHDASRGFSEHGSTWFRIGHSGDRYLHPGSFSKGCITVNGETSNWELVYENLIAARKDDKSVGTMNIVDKRSKP